MSYFLRRKRLIMKHASKLFFSKSTFQIVKSLTCVLNLIIFVHSIIYRMIRLSEIWSKSIDIWNRLIWLISKLCVNLTKMNWLWCSRYDVFRSFAIENDLKYQINRHEFFRVTDFIVIYDDESSSLWCSWDVDWFVLCAQRDWRFSETKNSKMMIFKHCQRLINWFETKKLFRNFCWIAIQKTSLLIKQMKSWFISEFVTLWLINANQFQKI